jgi:hypothetical protein
MAASVGVLTAQVQDLTMALVGWGADDACADVKASSLSAIEVFQPGAPDSLLALPFSTPFPIFTEPQPQHT